MSVVIDTCDFETEVEAGLEAETVETDAANVANEAETSPKLDDVEPPQEPPVASGFDQSDDEESEGDFKSKMWNAEMRCKGKEAIVEDLKEQLKFAKADYEDSVASLRKLATWGREPEQTTNSDQPALTAESAPIDEGQNESWPDTSEATDWKTADSEAWRNISLEELLRASDIAGLGDKKLDALADIARTFGEFQDLRAQASLDGKQLKDVLPNGFGEKVTDQIEEVFLSAIGPFGSFSKPISSIDEGKNTKAEAQPVSLEDL